MISMMNWLALGEIAIVAVFLIVCLSLLAWLGKIQQQHPEEMDWRASREELDV
jgi:hypothetical protein